MQEDKMKLSNDIVVDMRSKWVDLANKHQFNTSDFISVLTSFYSTMVCNILINEDYNKQLIFINDLRAALKKIDCALHKEVIETKNPIN